MHVWAEERESRVRCIRSARCAGVILRNGRRIGIELKFDRFIIYKNNIKNFLTICIGEDYTPIHLKPEPYRSCYVTQKTRCCPRNYLRTTPQGCSKHMFALQICVLRAHSAGSFLWDRRGQDRRPRKKDDLARPRIYDGPPRTKHIARHI